MLTDISAAVSDTQVQGDPQTPVFVAAAGTPVRFRVVYPGGDGDQVFAVHGHGWQEEPYVQNSTVIGSNPLSQWLGFQQVSPYLGVNLVLESAGGTFRVPGDYLYHAFMSQYYVYGGLWGVLRVTPPGKDAVIVAQAVVDEKTQQLTIAGVNSVNPATRRFAAQVTLSAFRGGATAPEPLGSVPVNSQDGTWKLSTKSGMAPGISIRAQSAQGGEDTTTLQSGPAPAAVTLRAPAPPTVRPTAPNAVSVPRNSRSALINAQPQSAGRGRDIVSGRRTEGRERTPHASGKDTLPACLAAMCRASLTGALLYHPTARTDPGAVGRSTRRRAVVSDGDGRPWHRNTLSRRRPYGGGCGATAAPYRPRQFGRAVQPGTYTAAANSRHTAPRG